jgi:hypothetical protein
MDQRAACMRKLSFDTVELIRKRESKDNGFLEDNLDAILKRRSTDSVSDNELDVMYQLIYELDQKGLEFSTEYLKTIDQLCMIANMWQTSNFEKVIPFEEILLRFKKKIENGLETRYLN